MECIPVAQIKKVADNYRELSERLSRDYKGQWDDPVHDSFGEYNRKVNNTTDTIMDIFKSTQNIADSSLDNNDIISKADKVMNEVNSV